MGTNRTDNEHRRLCLQAATFSAEVAQAFPVTNETDSQTDYFQPDRFIVLPTHPRYAEVWEALQAWNSHVEATERRRVERICARPKGFNAAAARALRQAAEAATPRSKAE